MVSGNVDYVCTVLVSDIVIGHDMQRPVNCTLPTKPVHPPYKGGLNSNEG